MDEYEVVSNEEVTEKWEMFGTMYTRAEKRLLCAMCIQVGVEVAFSNHIYWYHNHLYRQTQGGAIGARLTVVVARVNMDRWEERMMLEIERMKLEIYLFTKYIDDINLALSVVPPGWRWEQHVSGEWILEWSREQEYRDLESEELGARRAFRLVREEADLA